MRTGRLEGITKVVIPYNDGDNRTYALLTIEGKIYASKLYAGIKEFVLDNFGVEVDKDWLANVPIIVNSNDPEMQVSEEERAERIEAFIQSLELKDEVEDISDSGSQTEDACKAESQVCNMPCESEECRC